MEMEKFSTKKKRDLQVYISIYTLPFYAIPSIGIRKKKKERKSKTMENPTTFYITTPSSVPV